MGEVGGVDPRVCPSADAVCHAKCDLLAAVVGAMRGGGRADVGDEEGVLTGLRAEGLALGPAAFGDSGGEAVVGIVGIEVHGEIE
jgi:hypothetical protein